MKVIIAGGRDFSPTTDQIDKALAFAKGVTVTEVVCGMATGVDTAGLKWAQKNKIKVAEYPADWNKHGKAAGPIRNEQMAKYGDVLVAFWDGKSKGTKNMIENMQKLHKPTYCFTYDSFSEVDESTPRQNR